MALVRNPHPQPLSQSERRVGTCGGCDLDLRSNLSSYGQGSNETCLARYAGPVKRVLILVGIAALVAALYVGCPSAGNDVESNDVVSANEPLQQPESDAPLLVGHGAEVDSVDKKPQDKVGQSTMRHTLRLRLVGVEEGESAPFSIALIHPHAGKNEVFRVMGMQLKPSLETTSRLVEPEIDIAAVVSEGPGRIRVVVKHPRYSIGEAEFDLADLRSSKRVESIDLDVHLAKSYSINVLVRSPVNDESQHGGVVVHRVNEQGAIIQKLDDYRSPVGVDRKVGRISKEKTFTLRVPSPGRYAVSAVVGAFPIQTRVIDVVDREITLDPFVIAQGLTIRGRVMVKGKRAASAGISATCKDFTTAEWPPSFTFAHSQWTIREGRPVRASHSTDTNEHGEYELIGLSDTAYLVRLSLVQEWAIDERILNEQCIETPPRDGVDFSIEGATVTLKLQHDGEPPNNVRVVFVRAPIDDSESGHPQFSRYADDAGTGIFLVCPGVDYTVVVVGDTSDELMRFKLAPVGVGEHFEREVALPSIEARGTIVVRPTTADGGALSYVSVSVNPVRKDGQRFGGVGISTNLENGAVAIDDLKPTVWDVSVSTKQGVDSGDDKFYLAASKRVRLPPGKTVEVPLTMAVGGRLAMSVVNAKGALLPASVGLMQEERKGPPLVFVNPSSVNRISREEPRHGLAPITSGFQSESLPVGEYSLVVVHKGYKERRVPIVISPKKITRVRVVLEAE